MDEGDRQRTKDAVIEHEGMSWFRVTESNIDIICDYILDKLGFGLSESTLKKRRRKNKKI